MKIHDNCGTATYSHFFNHFTWHHNALHIAGKLNYTISGRNLHFLAPFIATGLLPENLLSGLDEPILPDIFAHPFSIRIDNIAREKPPWITAQNGIGRALPHKIPCSQKFAAYRWILIEGNDGTALHQQKDFHFITPAKWSPQWHIVFASQAYALEFTSNQERDRLNKELVHYLPDPNNHESNANSWINAFSIFDYKSNLLPRFIAPKIRRIEFHNVDTSRLSEMSGACVQNSSLPDHEKTIGMEFDR
jgi:hypothetical protein